MPQYTYPDDFNGTFWTVVDGDYYVSTVGNDITGDGSPKKPFLTVARAFELALDGEKIIIGPDEYVSYAPTDVSPSGAHLPCRVATVGNFTVGAGGGGQAIIDDIQTNAGDRVLVWQQTDPVENGIYIVATGVWERASDFNSLSDVVSGKLIPVLEGTQNGRKAFQHITQGNIVIDSTSISIERATATDWGEIGGVLTDQTDLSDALNLKADDADLVSHTTNTSNPHGVTKAQVGLGNVDDTSDAAKPVSTAQQTALDAKADSTALASHASDQGNPHAVTKAQVGLGNVDDTSDAAKPVSIAQQAALDTKVNVLDIEDTLTSISTTTPLSANQGFVLKGLIDSINTLLSSDDTTLDELQEIVDYIKQNKSVLDSLGITNIAGLQAALDAKADLTALNAHSSNTANPHSVTKTQVGLGNVDDTSDAAKPVSTAQQAALDAKADSSALASHASDQGNPHAVTKAQVGLGNVDDTSDAAKPVSTAQQAALDTKVNVLDIEDTLTSISTTTPLSANQGFVLKGLIDSINTLLSSDDTTLDELQEIVDYIKQNKSVLDSLGIANIAGLQAALDAKADLTALNAHSSNTANPHSVTKTQVGLGNVDDTSDAAKPVSAAQQTALDAKADLTALNTHTSSLANPHGVTKAQVGLGNVDNTSDAAKPVSTAQQTALDTKADSTALASHASDQGNPHAVTKAQVGLGNVDNTSDAAKPVSTAQQAALNLKADITYVDGEISNLTASLDKATPMGLLDCSTDPNYPTGELGDYYYVPAGGAGKIGGVSGVDVQVGDKIQCIATSAGGDQATVGSEWIIFQGNLDKVTTAEMQAATDDEKYVTATKSYDGWYSWLNNKIVSELNTTDKTIVGAINEALITSAFDGRHEVIDGNATLTIASVSSGSGFGATAISTLNLEVEGSGGNAETVSLMHVLGPIGQTTFRINAYDAGTFVLTDSGMIGIGDFQSVTNANGITIGTNSSVTGDNGIAIGASAVGSNTGAIAIGSGSSSTGFAGIAIGQDASVNQTGAIAIGESAQVTAGSAGIAIGQHMDAANQNIIIGYALSNTQNLIGNTFEVNFFGITVFKAGSQYGTQMMVDSDPDTNLTVAQNGVIAYDSTDHEFRAFVNGNWKALGGGASISGTPVGGQVAIWSDASTIQGMANLSFNTASNILSITGSQPRLSLVESDDSNNSYDWVVNGTTLSLRRETGGSSHFMQITSAGAMVLNQYGSGTKTGTAAYMMALDSSGNIIEEALPGIGTTINNNADNRIITGSGTANTLVGESEFTYGGGIMKLENSAPLMRMVHSGTVDSNYDVLVNSTNFQIRKINDALNSTDVYLQFANTGALQLGNYGSGAFSGTATRYLAVDTNGNVIEQPVPVIPDSTTINSNANNRIITGSDTANSLYAESSLTYDASTGILFASNTGFKINASQNIIFQPGASGILSVLSERMIVQNGAYSFGINVDNNPNEIRLIGYNEASKIIIGPDVTGSLGTSARVIIDDSGVTPGTHTYLFAVEGNSSFAGVNTYAQEQIYQNSSPRLLFKETGQTANQGYWDIYVNDRKWAIRLLPDDLLSATDFLTISRLTDTTAAIDIKGDLAAYKIVSDLGIITSSTGAIDFNGVNLENIADVYIDGGVLIGSPSGGSQGAGTINVEGLYIEGVAVGGYLPLAGGTVTGNTSFNNEVTINADADQFGLKILRNLDSPDEPASLMIASDADGTDDLAFEIRGNSSGTSVDTSTTLSSPDTKFAIFGNGHTVIGRSGLGTSYAQVNGSLLDVNGILNVEGNILTGGAVIIGGTTVDISRISDWDTAHGWGDHAAAGYLYDSGGTISGALTINGDLSLGNVKISNNANRLGLLRIEKAGAETWSGISIEHSSTSAWSLMGDQDDFGLYDDVNNEWIIRYNENASLELFYNGSNKLSTSSTGITVTGSGTATDWIATSDERLKTNLRPFGKVLDKIMAMRGSLLHFDWKSGAKDDIGYTAQQLRSFLPDFVQGSETLGISYGKLSTVALEGVAEVNEEVERLRMEVEELKDQLKRYIR